MPVRHHIALHQAATTRSPAAGPRARLFTLLPWATCLAVLASAVAPGWAGPAAPADPLAAQARAAATKGVAFLHRVQAKDGSWDYYPAMTALAVTALLRCGGTERSDPAIARGVQFLLRSAKPNGAICIDGDPAKTLPNYNTALALVALASTRNPAYRPVILKAQHYLEQIQFDESEGFKRVSPLYGGIGYGDDPGDETHPDLSNLQTALEGLHESGVPSTAAVFRKALVYVQRVQNRRESNDTTWVRRGPNDGGFLYEAQGGTKTRSGKHASYGAMTYAGVKSYLYCGVPMADPRVQAAWRWILAHYTVKEHPAMGTTSLYYYYLTMATTLHQVGQRVITDASGRRHDWTRDLAAELVSRQRRDGSWVNANTRYWEDRPVLVTSYSLICLAYCLRDGAAARPKS